MPAFQSKTFRRAPTASSALGERIGAIYRSKLPRHPFLLFGLPFMLVIVAGSFALTPAAALRYERYDRKVQQLSQEETMQLGLRGPDGEEGIKRNPRRRVIGNERDEYYVSLFGFDVWSILLMHLHHQAAHGQGFRQLGTKTSAKIQGRTGWEAVN